MTPHWDGFWQGQVAVEERVKAEQGDTGAQSRPLYESVLGQLTGLAAYGYPLPLRKRLALLSTGLIVSQRASVGELASALAALGISPAKEESINRRLERVLGDPRLDPEQILPQVARLYLPEFLAELRQTAAAARSGDERPQVGLVVDESSKGGDVHLLVAGLEYRGVILPLAIRVWRQNTPLPEGYYFQQLSSLLAEVHRLLPPAWRLRLVVVMDRAYAIPALFDLLKGLEWDWLVRLQSQTQVQLGSAAPVRVGDLVGRPGDWRCLGFGAATLLDPDLGEPVRLFKKAGWRWGQVIADWDADAAEPWLLFTSLPASRQRLGEYARRWAIERLFWSWKSHGWAIESSGVRDPARFGRLLVGLALATWWRLAMAVPVAAAHLADLAQRAARVPARPPTAAARQLVLPLDFGDPPTAEPPAHTQPTAAATSQPPRRAWAAKFSLFTWGTRIACSANARFLTPALCWRFPNWNAPTWSAHCAIAYAKPT